MGFTFSGGIPVATGFANNSPLPGDMYGFVDTRQDLNLPTHPTAPGVFEEHLRFICRTVVVVSERMEYWLKNGLTDDDWEIKGAVSDTLLPDWANNTNYVEKQIVWYGGALWRALSTHTSNVDGAFEDDKANWVSTSADTFTMSSTLTPFGNIPAGTPLTNLTFAQMMDMQVNPDVPPNVTFTASPAFGLRERGVAMSSIGLSAEFVRTKYPIIEVEFLEGTTSLGTATISNPNGETVTHTGLSLSGTTDTTYAVRVIDAEGLNSSKTGTFSFANPIFIGSVPASINVGNVAEANVTAMTKRVANPSTQSLNYTVNNEKFAIWIPDSWGPISRIIDPNGFNMTASFESVTLNIENSANEAVPGRVYILNNPTSQSGFLVTFYFG